MILELLTSAKTLPLSSAALAALLAGLISFPHCGVMCGPLLGVFRDNARLYQAGRLTGYSALGAVFGTIGASVDRVGVVFDIQGLSLWVIVGIAALSILLRALRLQSGPSMFMRVMSRLRSTLSKPAWTFVAGAASALLPCGVLYPLWAVSAASGSTASGAVVSFCFAAATIPALFVGQKMAGAVGRWLGTSVLRYGAAVVLLGSLGLLFWQRTEAFSAYIAGSDNQCHVPVRPDGAGGPVLPAP